MVSNILLKLILLLLSISIIIPSGIIILTFDVFLEEDTIRVLPLFNIVTNILTPTIAGGFIINVLLTLFSIFKKRLFYLLFLIGYNLSLGTIYFIQQLLILDLSRETDLIVHIIIYVILFLNIVAGIINLRRKVTCSPKTAPIFKLVFSDIKERALWQERR